MEEVSYADIRQIRTAYTLLAKDRRALGPVLVHFEDGVCVLPRRRLCWNILFWGMLVSYNLPILMSKHIFTVKGPITIGTIRDIHTKLYIELIHTPGVTQDMATTTLWEQINELSRYIRSELPEYQETISMLDLALIAEDPKIKALVEGDVPMIKGIPYIEHRIRHIEKELSRLLSTKGEIQNEVLLRMQEAKVLNPGQVRQMFGPLGVKTDVNESVILHYIQHSIVHGMRSIEDYATEASSARKAAFYTHDAIENSQYFGRMLHLITSTIRTIHSSDCGSTVLLPVRIPLENSENFIGKNIMVDGHLVALDADTLNVFAGETVLMRSPLTCRHTSGICKICGGDMMDFISDKLDIGIFAAISLAEPTSQKILSTKHYSNTSSVSYMLHPSATQFLQVENNMISFKEEWIKQSDKWMLGIPHGNIRSLNDLLHIDGRTNIRERIFSTMSSMTIMDVTGKTYVIPLEVDGVSPFMTKRALLYLKSKYSEITADEEYLWVPMDGLKDMRRFAFLKTVVINASMMAFVHSVRGFLTKNISKYTSASLALEDFSNTVYSKVSVNIVHLEIILKAFLVTSKTDFTSPIVENCDDVMFSKLGDIIAKRTLGGELAFERLKKYLSSPGTYVHPKENNPMDRLIGI